MIWSETPPTKAGPLWVKRWNGTVCPAEIVDDEEGLMLQVGQAMPWVIEPGIEEYYLFGPPIPSPEQCHEIAKGQS